MESAIGKLALACLTPRGGKANHRFIIPDGSKLSESELLRLAGKARQADQVGDDYLRVGHTVQQLSGRDGDEWLVVAGAGLKKLPAKDRENLRRYLAGKATELDGLLRQIDWDAVLDRTVVPSAELTAWEAGANEVLLQWEPEPPGWLKKWLRRGLVMASALILIFSTCYFLIWPTGAPPVVAPPDKDKPPVVAETPVLVIAEKLGWKKEQKKEEDIDFLLDKMSSLFTKDSNEDKEKKIQLQKYLAKLFKIIFPKESNSKELDEFSSNNGFLANLEMLFPKTGNYEMDPCGLVSEKPGLKNLKNAIDPKKIGNFRSVYGSFVELAKVKIKPGSYLEKESKFKELIAQLEKQPELLKDPPVYEGQVFFCPCDGKFLSTLQSVFESTAFYEKAPVSLDEGIKKLQNMKDKGPDVIFSMEAIKGFKNSKAFSNDMAFLNALEGMMKNLQSFGNE